MKTMGTCLEVRVTFYAGEERQDCAVGHLQEVGDANIQAIPIQLLALGGAPDMQNQANGCSTSTLYADGTSTTTSFTLAWTCHCGYERANPYELLNVSLPDGVTFVGCGSCGDAVVDTTSLDTATIMSRIARRSS